MIEMTCEGAKLKENCRIFESVGRVCIMSHLKYVLCRMFSVVHVMSNRFDS